ncbi:histidinol-phosphate transaminase [Clostridium sp. MSJ-4]|uniref:Histidinol-phosphate aminotransferase n=1 Tax=Clostridium simiarum TaxID=2841506 RepID=A0ABS6F2U6_9CLOT|nr:histidinol-phosphate transaminase [Clostridium simiarum]MBU5592593.1 histidinol-phosphate transaminase [Clostridium simiarum]
MSYSIRKDVLNIEKYVAGKPISEVKRELGLDEVIKLASNENPLGCSPKAKEVIMNMINDSALYPDSSSYELKRAIAKKLNVSPEQIFCGAGSDSLIKVLCNTLLESGDETIMGQVTFPRYETSTKLMGAKAIKIPMKNNALDLEAMVDAITDKTKIIWFCNPNNPTGNIFKKADFDKILNKIPDSVIIVMDEAYVEYVVDPDFPDSLELLKNHPNMIILRTFSKAYGLASLRCGYGVASEDLVQYVNRVINPFDVNLFAQNAAVVAIEDDEFLKKVYDTNNVEKEFLYSEFKNLGLEYIETNTNFIMVNLNRDDKPIFDALLKKGIIIRPGFLLDMPQWLRISIGTREQNEKFVKALKEIL